MLPVIHIFHFSKVIFENLGTSLGKYRAEDCCPGGRSMKTSTATCFLKRSMSLLLYIIYIATGNWKNAHF